MLREIRVTCLNSFRVTFGASILKGDIELKLINTLDLCMTLDLGKAVSTLNAT